MKIFFLKIASGCTAILISFLFLTIGISACQKDEADQELGGSTDLEENKCRTRIINNQADELSVLCATASDGSCSCSCASAPPGLPAGGRLPHLPPGRETMHRHLHRSALPRERPVHTAGGHEAFQLRQADLTRLRRPQPAAWAIPSRAPEWLPNTSAPQTKTTSAARSGHWKKCSKPPSVASHNLVSEYYSYLCKAGSAWRLRKPKRTKSLRD